MAGQGSALVSLVRTRLMGTVAKGANRAAVHGSRSPVTDTIDVCCQPDFFSISFSLVQVPILTLLTQHIFYKSQVQFQTSLDQVYISWLVLFGHKQSERR